MLYYLSTLLQPYFGPARLLQSHALLLAGATFTAAFLAWIFLPRLWDRLPHDRGKVVAGDKMGETAKGKPTGAGYYVSLICLPVILLFAPLKLWDLAAVFALYGAMLFGYLDDKAVVPWGELKKGLLDAVVSIAIAAFIFLGHSEQACAAEPCKMVLWFPFVKTILLAPWYVYIPIAAFILWFTMNATNCSDGVDGLAGSLTLITLTMLAVILYVVVGYRPVAHYFLIPAIPDAARWAIVVMAVAGGFGGYLWYNAEPSTILMGDAGSRFLGILVATASLMTGNFFFVIALSPVVLVNGGGGLGKLVLLRLAKKVGFDIGDDTLIRRIRFPLHDHCKKNLNWKNPQVLVRFVLLQLVVMPILLLLLLKVR